jgi:mRNA interferase RelE/StbE
VLVRYNKKFLKQLAQMPSETRKKIETFAFQELPSANSLGEIGKIEKMQGCSGFYKARFGSYRVGMKFDNGILTLMLAMDRKEIYKFFP